LANIREDFAMNEYVKFTDLLKTDPTLGALGTLGGAPVQSENLSPTEKSTAAPVIAPRKWVERVTSPAPNEPRFSEPWLARRGRIEWQENILLHFCFVCGAWGSYGYGVDLREGRSGQWFCANHRLNHKT
jgi:hypothetical protein